MHCKNIYEVVNKTNIIGVCFSSFIRYKISCFIKCYLLFLSNYCEFYKQLLKQLKIV